MSPPMDQCPHCGATKVGGFGGPHSAGGRCPVLEREHAKRMELYQAQIDALSQTQVAALKESRGGLYDRLNAAHVASESEPFVPICNCEQHPCLHKHDPATGLVAQVIAMRAETLGDLGVTGPRSTEPLLTVCHCRLLNTPHVHDRYTGVPVPV